MTRPYAPKVPEVLISEVGPRDGLQSVKATMPTADKLRWIDALAAAGLREIEVASFVPAQLLPQMADAAQVVRHARQHTGVRVMALVPNLRGAQAALEAGAQKLTLPVSASPAHSMANVRKSPEAMVEEVAAVLRWRDQIAPGVPVEVGMSTAFGCTLQGAVPEDDVLRLAVQLAQMGVDEVGLSDTTGMANPAQDATTTAAIGLSGKEARRYSFLRAIQSMIPGAAADAGLEREISRTIAKTVGREAEGIFIPSDIFGTEKQQRDFQVGTAGEAGNLVQTSVMGSMFTDVLRPMLVMAQLGITILPGLRSNVAIPRKTVAGTLAMLTEIAAASETQPTTALVTLSPKRVSAYTDPSKQAIIQSEVGIEAMIRDDLVSGAAVLLENQGINGSGSSPNARGIRNVSGIGSVVGGTNGLAIAWSHITGLEAACANANAGMTDRAGYLINTKAVNTAKNTQKATNLQFLWDNGDKPLNGYRAAVTNNVPSNLTKGSSSGVCSSLLFSSDWSMFVLGLFGGLDVTVDPYSLATTGQIRITLNQFFDFACRQPGAFASMDDALTP